MAKKFDPAKKLKKWSQNTSGATQAYKDGIQGVTDSPMAAAAQKADTAKTRYARAIDSGQWAASLQAVPLQTWKDNAVNVGAARLQDGVTKGAPKMARYLNAAAPVYAANVAEISAMPNATDEDRRQRMLRNLDLMKAMKGLGKR